MVKLIVEEEFFPLELIKFRKEMQLSRKDDSIGHFLMVCQVYKD